jgi:hypothetical protein
MTRPCPSLWVCFAEQIMVDQTPETAPAARAVGMLLAPVVACLRGDDEGFGMLVEGALDDGAIRPALRAAPTVARVYLRLAPPPDGSQHIVHTYVDAAQERFDGDAVRVGAECLAVAQAPERVAAIAFSVFTQAALERGEHLALEGAIASVWWAASESARLRSVDPIEEAAAICRYVARVA